jgi:hypothetical protein
MIRCRRKNLFSHRGKMRHSLERERFLAFEMMEEAALGEARIVAYVVNRRGRIALGADDVQCGVEQPRFRFVSGVGGCHGEPYRLFGMQGTN